MLPSDFIRAIKISPKVPYKIIENKLVANVSDIVLTYVSDVDEENFSPAFLNAFIYILSAELSLSLLDDVAKFNLFYRLYNSELREARFLDSAQETAKHFDNFSLIDVRY